MSSEYLQFASMQSSKFLTTIYLFIIGAEIENPFGYDKNDLPLDEYCKASIETNSFLVQSLSVKV